MLLDAAPNLEWQTVIPEGYLLGARLTDCVSLTCQRIQRVTNGDNLFVGEIDELRMVQIFPALRRCEHERRVALEDPRLRWRATGWPVATTQQDKL
jgi:hypothetical protein